MKTHNLPAMPGNTPFQPKTKNPLNPASPVLHHWLVSLSHKFHTPVRFVDPKGCANLTHALPPRPVSYCDLLAKDPVLSKKCQSCNLHHAEMAWTGKPGGAYTCHAGLTDIVLPIRPKGKTVAVLLTGRIRLNQGKESDFQKIPKKPVPGAETELQWRTAWEQLPVWNQTQLDDFLAHLELVAARIAENHEPGSLPKRLDVTQVLNFTRANIQKPVYLKEMAIAFGMSQSNLSNMFRKDSGLRLTQWLLWLRLGEAWNQLSRGNRTVAQVARGCGFLDLPYFSRVFKRRFYLTPQQVLLGKHVI